jgi:hypothetical protein
MNDVAELWVGKIYFAGLSPPFVINHVALNVRSAILLSPPNGYAGGYF